MEIAGRTADALIAVEPDAALLRHFDEAGGAGRPRYGQIPMCYGADAEECAETARRYVEAGFTHLALYQIGADRQKDFITWAERDLLPALRSL